MLRVGCGTIDINVMSSFIELGGIARVVGTVARITPVVSRGRDLQFGLFDTRIKLERAGGDGTWV